MKKCPTCTMIVDDESVCHVCGTTLTYEEPLRDVRERRVMNRYYLAYLLKNVWFSALCILICVVRLLIVPSQPSKLLVFAGLLLIISLYSSLNSRRIQKRQQVYSAQYFEGLLWIRKYLCGGAAVLLCFIL